MTNTLERGMWRCAEGALIAAVCVSDGSTRSTSALLSGIGSPP